MEKNSLNNHLIEIKTRLVRIDTTLEFQAKQLEEHIRRTDQLETEVLPVIAFKNRLAGGLVLLASIFSSGLLIALIKYASEAHK